MTKANSIIMNIPYVILILVTIVLHFSYAITITNNDIVDETWNKYLNTPPDEAIIAEKELSTRASNMVSSSSISNSMSTIGEVDLVISGGGNLDAFYFGMQQIFNRISKDKLNIIRYAGASAGGMAPFEIALKGEIQTLQHHLAYGLLETQYPNEFSNMLNAAAKQDHSWRQMGKWMIAKYNDTYQMKLNNTVTVALSCLDPLPKQILVSKYFNEKQTFNAFMGTGTVFQWYQGMACSDGGAMSGHNMTPLFQDKVRGQIVINLMKSGASIDMVSKYNLTQFVTLAKHGQDVAKTFLLCNDPINNKTCSNDMISYCPIDADTKSDVCVNKRKETNAVRMSMMMKKKKKENNHKEKTDNNNINKINNSLLPPYWDEAILLENLPKDEKTNATIINPWVYTERLGAMKTLILKTTHSSPCLFESNINKNILWGLALQFGWQFSSGRLFTSNYTMTSKSWWADMNYQLMIVPLLGASAAAYPNIPANIYVEHPRLTNGSIFCRNNTIPSKTNACIKMKMAQENWKTFFMKIQEAENNCSKFGRDDAFDHLLGFMWNAHTSSLDEGMNIPYVKSSLNNFATEEAAFGLGWASLVEFIAAAHFVTDFNGTAAQQTLLPLRMLIKGDVPGKIKDMPKLTNRGIKMIEELSKINADSGGRVLKLWLRAMCSKKGREEGRFLINEAIRDPSVLIGGILKIIRDEFRPCD